MFIEERHKAILDTLESSGRISVAEIQRKYGVGYDTAKRDLTILEGKGLLKRTHGGAVAARDFSIGKPAEQTCRDFGEVKPSYLAVAKKAASMICDNDVIFVTAATVGWLITENLPSGLNCRIAVNSTVLAEALRGRDGIETIMLGGVLDQNGNAYDMLARETLRGLRFNKCFITSACVSDTFGLSVQKTPQAEFLRGVIAASKRVIGLYPSEKLGFDSIISICPASSLNVLITDSDAGDEETAKYTELGVEVVRAEAEGE